MTGQKFADEVLLFSELILIFVCAEESHGDVLVTSVRAWAMAKVSQPSQISPCNQE